MRRRAPRPLALAVRGLTSDLEPAVPLAKVQRVWREAVGEVLAEAGEPTAERNGVLTVTCSDAVWSAELEMMGRQLTEQLNAVLGEPLITKLRCRTG
jgi:predicted nucleic acid-binding Zn ribbon protein